MKRMDQINVIPFIDIMLVLLAIVLTTATFISEGRLEIQLPQASSEDKPTELKPLEIGIQADGKLFIDAVPVSLDALTQQLEPLEKETPIVLRVDAAARFESFVSVIDQLKSRHLERLTILTRRQ